MSLSPILINFCRHVHCTCSACILFGDGNVYKILSKYNIYWSLFLFLQLDVFVHSILQLNILLRLGFDDVDPTFTAPAAWGLTCSWKFMGKKPYEMAFTVSNLSYCAYMTYTWSHVSTHYECPSHPNLPCTVVINFQMVWYSDCKSHCSYTTDIHVFSCNCVSPNHAIWWNAEFS